MRCGRRKSCSGQTATMAVHVGNTTVIAGARVVLLDLAMKPISARTVVGHGCHSDHSISSLVSPPPVVWSSLGGLR